MGLLAVDAGSMGIMADGYIYFRESDANSTKMSFDMNNGEVGIGVTDPLEKLHVNGNVRGNQSGALRISTGNGYVDIGPKNASWSHFYTDRARYFFDKEIRVDQGMIGSYDENLQLRTSGTTRIFASNTSGAVGIGTTSPASGYLLDVNGAIKATDGNSTEWNTAYTKTTTDALAGTGLTWASGQLNVDGTFGSTGVSTTGSIDLGNAVLSDNANRAGLLEVTRGGSQTWSGVSIEHTSTSAWSIMGDQDDFGLYDDQNNDWILSYNENADVQLRYNGVSKLFTSSDGVKVSGLTNGDARITLEADTDNSNESDNAEIVFIQDGGLVTGFIGFEGQGGTKSTGTVDNAFILGSENGTDRPIQLIVQDQVQATVKSSGLEVVGTVTALDGNLTEWNTAYTNTTTDALAGTGLTWAGGKLNVDGVNTDDQKIDALSLSGTTLNISLEGDGEATKTLNLAPINTDNQKINTLALSGNTLSISLENDGEAAQTLDLSPIDTKLTEAEVDAYVANNSSHE